jgi:hypothetical protein
MTVDLGLYIPDDIETLIIAHLWPLRLPDPKRHVGSFRDATKDGLPFVLVTHVTGTEDPSLSLADPVVSVHTLCDKALGATAARDEAQKTHRRMLLLTQGGQITVGSRTAGIDYLDVVEAPHWEFYSDQILRKVGRYRLGLPYAPA